MSSPPDTVRPGLRERKKAKTRAAIHAHALRLFAAQGYHATTVEQIADAAEVSPSTFFRYFPTKEDVVLHDELDPKLIASLTEQPAELGPIAAIRRSMRETFAGLSEAEAARELQRHELARTVPELRARMLEQFAGGLAMLSDALAERLGRSPDDIEVRTLAGAVVGVGLSALIATEQNAEDFVEVFDAGLAQLEAGFDL
jgi:AcrR family transcriptional regulator